MTKRINIINLVIGLILIALLIYKLLLASQDFPVSFINGFQRTIIFVGSIIIILFLKLKYRGYIVLGYILLTYLLGYLDLWKVSTEKYLNKNEKYFSKIAKELKSDSINCSIGLRADTISFRCAAKENKPFNQKLFQESLLELSRNTEVLEIEKDKHVLLFIFDRFIDNGYGIAYISPANFEEIRKMDNYRLNGFELTGLANIKGNWYYISFT